MVFVPSASNIPAALNLTPAIVAGTLLTRTDVSVSFAVPVTVIVGVVKMAFAGGYVICRTGGTVSRFTTMLSEPRFPAASRASTVMVLVPSVRRSPSYRNVLADTCAVLPFTVTVDVGSLIMPETVMEAVFTYWLSWCEVILTEGAIVSVEKCQVRLAELCDTSDTLTVTGWIPWGRLTDGI